MTPPTAVQSTFRQAVRAVLAADQALHTCHDLPEGLRVCLLDEAQNAMALLVDMRRTLAEMGDGNEYI